MVSQAVKSTLTVWRNDLAAGAIAAIVSLPVCLASGLLAFAPLGPGYAVAGAAAGLCGAIVACCVSALFATSSFVVTTSRVSEALLLGTLTTALLAVPAVAGDKDLIIFAMFLCVLLAGLWQTIFGLAGVARIIKFTPHPVLVGFLNGVSVLVVLSPLKPYFQINPGTSTSCRVRAAVDVRPAHRHRRVDVGLSRRRKAAPRFIVADQGAAGYRRVRGRHRRLLSAQGD